MQQGGVILYPTDTVWGIGCDATNSDAVERVFRIKKRADNKAMLVLLDNPAKLQTYVQDVPDIARDMIDLTDSPLTIIYEGAKNLAPNLVSEDGCIGIRITDELFSKELCKQFRKPLVSTSANVSGSDTPLFFDEISNEIKQSVDYIVQFRQKDKTKTKPSSIVKLLKNGTINIIRK